MAKAYAVENNDPLKHHPFSIETKSIASANSLRGHNATPQEEMSPKVKDNASMGYTLVPTEKTQNIIHLAAILDHNSFINQLILMKFFTSVKKRQC